MWPFHLLFFLILHLCRFLYVKIGGIGVTYNVKDDIINKNAKEVKKDVHYIGKTDKKFVFLFSFAFALHHICLSFYCYMWPFHLLFFLILVDNKNIDTLLYMKKLVNERKKYTSCIKIKYYQK